MTPQEIREKIDALFPTDGVYAIENDAGSGEIAQRIVTIQDGVVSDRQFAREHKHTYFDFFGDLWDGMKVQRLEGFTPNPSPGPVYVPRPIPEI